ncbi:hypothetical protein N9059_00565 [bacterium]|nr:hypothetical protein [bacterium]
MALYYVPMCVCVYIGVFTNNEHRHNDDQPMVPKNLDQRFAKRPQVYKRLQHLADLMDQAIAEGYTADQAEEIAVEQVKKLGADIIGDWAQSQSDVSVERALDQHPEIIRDGKKTPMVYLLRSYKAQ